MDYQRPQRVSVLDPIEPAIERVRLILFQPFDISKWLTIGFCAWLAILGQGGGSGFNFRFPGGKHPFGPGGPEIPGLSAIREIILTHLPLIIIGAAVIIPIIIIIGLVLCWLRSRGQFMFVHCVAGNAAEVTIPWKKFSRHGNSLFVFKIVFSIISMMIILIPIVLVVITFITLQAAGLTVAGVAGVMSAGFVVFLVAVALLLVVKFTNDFVVPIMFLQTSSVVAGWRTFLKLLGVNKARIVLYILFQIVISMVISFIVLIIYFIGFCACCLSCCISILLIIPLVNLVVLYFVTLVLLPLITFKRAYSLFYFSQFGPQFNVFTVQAGAGQC
ncbi:MAG: hypothetical protein ABSH16_06070 [Sedimentisphaerales bacterium]